MQVAEYLILTHLSANVEAAMVGAPRQTGAKRAAGPQLPGGRPLKQSRILTDRDMCATHQHYTLVATLTSDTQIVDAVL